jgi:hypothetical protein
MSNQQSGRNVFAPLLEERIIQRGKICLSREIVCLARDGKRFCAAGKA